MGWERHRETIPEALQELLRAYPFKTFQQRFLGLSSSELAAYQHEAFRKTDLDSNPFFTYEREGECEACFGLVHHGWHSELFGVPIYRVAHLLLRKHGPELCREVAAKVVEEAKALAADLLTVRLDCEELAMQRALSEEGFLTVGQSVKLGQTKSRLDITRLESYTSGHSAASAVTVRDFAPPDLEALQRIATASHQYSHFFNDPRLVGRGIERLFPAWVEKCCQGLAAAVLVVERDCGGSVLGFATLLLNEGLARHTGKRGGVVDFIVVAPEAQGQGIGKQLLAASLKWLCERADYIEVRTELANFPAIRLYRSFGLEVVSADVGLHRWIS